MKARSAKAKGSRLEREVAKALRDSGLDKKAGRMPLSGGSTHLKSDIHTSLPYSIECKNQEKWKPDSYMAQAERDAEGSNKIPVVIMSKNRQPEPFVMMKMGDWVNLLRMAHLENKRTILVGKNAYTKREQLKKG